MDSRHLLPASDGADDGHEYSRGFTIGSQRSKSITRLTCVLCLSGTLNFILGLLFIYSIRKNPRDERSPYAGLTRNVAIPWIVYPGSYDENTSALMDQRWDDLHVDDLGIIALPDTFVEQKNLPRARRFPWDESKGVYLLNSYHNLHCLVYLRTAINDHVHGQNIASRLPHLNHCLEALRQEVICNADDTPRWVGSHIPFSGDGQYRMCRDWNQLNDWAKQYSACFKDIDTDNKAERFSFCSKDSPYAEKVIKMFGTTNHLQDE